MKNNYLLFPADRSVPNGIETDTFTLTPLKPEHVHLDYAALMQSKDMLRLWSGSPWPQDDFTVQDNLADLEWHWLEHQERIAFTYTVLNPVKNTCLGCVYMKLLADMIEAKSEDGFEAVGDFVAAVRFWVTKPNLKTNVDYDLLRVLIEWFQTAWPLNEVYFHTHDKNKRQLEIFARANLHHHFTVNVPKRGGFHQPVKTARMPDNNILRSSGPMLG